jgi:hypothetical protein
MRSIAVIIAASALMLGPMPVGGAAEQTSLQVPQSIRHQHEQIMNRLGAFAKESGPIGVAASRALVVLKDHYTKEEAFVLPPLGLLPRLAKGEVSKDMEPAIDMAARVRAALAELHNDHIQITSLMNELVEAGKSAGNDELVRLATRIANQSLNDIEVAHPTTIVIGELVRQRLSNNRP